MTTSMTVPMTNMTAPTTNMTVPATIDVAYYINQINVILLEDFVDGTTNTTLQNQVEQVIYDFASLGDQDIYHPTAEWATTIQNLVSTLYELAYELPFDAQNLTPIAASIQNEQSGGSSEAQSWAYVIYQIYQVRLVLHLASKFAFKFAYMFANVIILSWWH